MLSRVGAACAEATTITIPSGHQAGDLMIIFAFRNGSTANPSIPAGWTNITNTTDGTSCSVSVGWKMATTSAETSGTWTNATGLCVWVGRGTVKGGIAATQIGTFAPSAGTTNTVTYAAVSPPGDMSWMIAFAGHRSIDTTLETAPTGMTNCANLAGASAEYAVHDTNAPASFASATVSLSGTASGWQTIVLEIKPPYFALENFKSGVRSISAGVLSVGEKIR